MNSLKDSWTNKRINERVNESMNSLKDAWIEKLTKERVNEWRKELIN